MKKLLTYLKKFKKESILSPLFKLLEALLDLFVPLVVANIINKGISSRDNTYIISQFVLLIVMAIVGLAFCIVAQYFAAKASVGVCTDLRQDLFDHIQKLSYAKLDEYGSDSFITRLTSDINQIQTGLNLALRLLLRSPFIVLGAMIMAFTINIPCAIIFVIVIPLLSIAIFGIMLASIPMFKKVQKALDNILTSVRENLTGVRVIRAFCREENEIKEFDEKNDILTKLNEKVGRLSALMNPITYALINIATIILIYCGAIQVNIGNIASGDVVALYNYMAQIVVELIKLATMIITIDKSLACADRISNVLDIEPGMDFVSDYTKVETENAICFDHVSFTYQSNSSPSIEDVSFVAKKGQTIGIIGGTGSGKSTIIDLIPRFYDATDGTVEVNGIDVKKYPKGKLIDEIGIVPQHAVLFQGTIRENLKYGNSEASDEEIWQALEIAQAKEIVEKKEGQLDYKIEQNGRNLSGGQKQRLTIARALVKKPSILILDDSASALDFATDAKLRQAISKLTMTVVIVSQRTSSIKHSDHILVMDDGLLVGIGKHDELMKSCSVYQEIYYSQFPDKKPKNYDGREVLA